MLVKNRMQWQKETEVLVVGYGGAGAATSIAAADAGAEVMVLEKQPKVTHVCSTIMSGGGFISPGDANAAFRFKQALDKVSEEVSWVDDEANRAWAEYGSQNSAWIESIGGKLTERNRGQCEHPTLPGAESIDLVRVEGGSIGLMELLYRQAAARGVETLYGWRGAKLLTNTSGRVVGVRAENNRGDVMNIKAARAVVLTTGGFEFNESMKLQYLRAYPAYFSGTLAATGDGVKMAQDVGADLWHMNCCSARVVMKFPGLASSIYPDLGGRGWYFAQVKNLGAAPKNPCGFIMVDRSARRFARENFKGHAFYYELAHYDSQHLEFPRIPCYWIFDDKRMKACSLPIGREGVAEDKPWRYKWSPDNKVEFNKGWIVAADNLLELGKKLGLDSNTLKKTVETYNGYCAVGKDPDFDRHPADLIPINNPPYYAVKLWPGGPNTQGGPRRNAKAQVLNTDGNPIPGLYSAGELGSVFGLLYSVGGNVGECLAFGRIAGENAVKEPRKH